MEWEKNFKDENRRLKFFGEMTTKVKCTFSQWFLTQFTNPPAWFDARLSYTRTLAIMSIVGAMLG